MKIFKEPTNNQLSYLVKSNIRHYRFFSFLIRLSRQPHIATVSIKPSSTVKCISSYFTQTWTTRQYINILQVFTHSASTKWQSSDTSWSSFLKLRNVVIHQWRLNEASKRLALLTVIPSHVCFPAITSNLQQNASADTLRMMPETIM